MSLLSVLKDRKIKKIYKKINKLNLEEPSKKRDLARAEQKMIYTRVTLSTVRKCMAKEEKMIGDEPASSFLKVIFGGLLVIGAVHSIIERIRR